MSHTGTGTMRASVAAIFGLNGFLAAMWVAHIPVIAEATGVGHDELGGLLLLLGGSAFVGMQICGPLIDRWGSRPLTIAAAVLAVLVLASGYFFNLGNGFFVQDGGIEYALVLAAALFILMVFGTGRASLDGALTRA